MVRVGGRGEAPEWCRVAEKVVHGNGAEVTATNGAVCEFVGSRRHLFRESARPQKNPNVFVDGEEHPDAVDVKRTKGASGGRTRVGRETGEGESTAASGGCPGYAVVNREGLVGHGTLDTCQALCDAVSQKTPDAVI